MSQLDLRWAWDQLWVQSCLHGCEWEWGRCDGKYARRRASEGYLGSIIQTNEREEGEGDVSLRPPLKRRRKVLCIDFIVSLLFLYFLKNSSKRIKYEKKFQTVRLVAIATKQKVTYKCLSLKLYKVHFLWMLSFFCFHRVKHCLSEPSGCRSP